MSSSSTRDIHSIKLKGPWMIVRRPGDAASMNRTEPETVHLPADWRILFGPVCGTAVFERRFNRPTGLTDRHRVRVLFAGVSGPIDVQLNGDGLSVERVAADVQAVEITARMQPHNLLTVQVRFDPAQSADDPGGLWRPVVMEIEQPQETRR